MAATTDLVFPRRISKKELKNLFEYSHTEQLREEIFTDDWLAVMGWTADIYTPKRTFSPQQTRQIFSMLKVRKLL